MKEKKFVFGLFFYDGNINRTYLRVFVLFICILYSCSNYSGKFENALELSGNNREQLENVIAYFSENPADSLKLRAAYFLIENMPGHYTLEGEEINKCRKLIDEDTISSFYFKKYTDIILTHFVGSGGNTYKIEDIRNIKADFLIRHINASFDILERYKWLDILPFDFFLEYILPYRFANERLDLWRDSLHLITNKLKAEYVMDNFTNSFSYLKSQFCLKGTKEGNRELQKKILGKEPMSDCYGIAFYNLWDCRSLGIPAMIHFIPAYANRNGYHYWKLDPPLLYKETDVTGALDRRSAKIYRYTYSRNEPVYPMDGEYVPELFLDPFIRDVTDLYYYTVNIEIEANNIVNDSPKHAYLCIFNNLQWTPIAVGEVNHKKACFNKMSKNIVYLPTFYKNKYEARVFNYPFVLNTKGDMKFMIPDTSVKQTIYLDRKNPDLVSTLSYYYSKLVGLAMEASNDKDFREVDTVFTFQESDKLFFRMQNQHLDKAYQWYRLNSAQQVSVAELYLYSAQDSLIIGDVDSSYMSVFDKDPLTNISIRNGQPLIIHFKEPVQISKMGCLPRNDGNGIYPGNTYELLYFDLNGWISLGVREATDLFIEYENVPVNALYWFRNRTSGAEERIFTYNNNLVKFW